MSLPDQKLRIGVTINVRQGEQSIWENGIFQNCILLVQLMQRIPEVEKAFLVHGAGVDSIPQGLLLGETGTEIIGLDEAMRTLDVVVEMSDQLADDWVAQFRSKGGRYVWMRVGNDYFIDVERAVYNLAPGALCSPKVYDAVWTIPQYTDCCSDYFELTTRAPVKILPHIWSPLFIRKSLAKLPADVSFGYKPGREQWRVCVFEPNLCMVKTSVIPMLVCEEAYRGNPRFPEVFRFCNTYKSKDNASFVRFAQYLDVMKNGIGSFEGRFFFYEFMAHYGDCVVSHQWHNAQNYLYYETLYGGYPLIHNSPIIKDLGYYYPDFDCRLGGEALLRAYDMHDQDLTAYKRKSTAFLQTLDIDHQPNIESYRRELNSLFSGETYTDVTDRIVG
jgi:hypothetical protein